MDAIDAEFEVRHENEEELIVPDDIQITVNQQEEQDFLDDKLSDEETIYPVDVESDAEMVAGELYDTVNSSAVISFNPHSRAANTGYSANIIRNSSPLVKKISEMSPDELMEANPALKQWMENMLKKNRAAEVGAAKQGDYRTVKLKQTKGNGSEYKKQKNKGGSSKEVRDASPLVVNKSPSDTTIYAPALKLVSPKNSEVVRHMVEGTINETLVRNAAGVAGIGDNCQSIAVDGVVHNRITNFLEQVRREPSCHPSRNAVTDTVEDQPQPKYLTSHCKKKMIEELWHDRWSYRLRDLKPQLSYPPGNNVSLINDNDRVMIPQGNLMVAGDQGVIQTGANNSVNAAAVPANLTGMQQGITDDEFFHLTCHVDANLRLRIQRGQFVELDKLLVKDKFKSFGSASNGQRMELVSKGG